ncbi:LacI family DNA-binding transcriptional regulator [Anaerobium acetethylicum]|uniref:LacI family transcriptional regulator, purine nucleotide synthesis repressor n=1 Tax=Anaerobium acetethylicum TaxID=1619234 RepID=A0A1D3TVG6_9FIRM|nr:LacI family DNA-binding transcriptional regulator [Anaerobium acetethylicum]SCP98142.1 LacI family transcriptional regulator, purine nucleotide synthesis repressor [Anaerobium acetethylicum]
MATIKDVAKLAGVSPTTVSIIISGKSKERGISAQTQERVFAVMKDLSYQPNLSARRLRSQDASKPTIAFFWPLDDRNSILASFLNALQKEIKTQNFLCEFIVQAYENDFLERDASSIINNSYNIAIIGAASNRDIAYLESLKPNMPIILINRESEQFSTVRTDHQKIGFQVADLFRKKGYSEVMVVSSSQSYVATGLRTQAFLYACSQVGINVSSEHIIKGPGTVTGGAQAAEEICSLSNAPKAVFFDSDSMAIGALHTFHKHHLRIPEDIEILTIGMLETETTAFCIPSLSVIEMPNAKIGHLVIDTVKKILESNHISPIHHMVDAEVILRESFTL